MATNIYIKIDGKLCDPIPGRLEGVGVDQTQSTYIFQEFGAPRDGKKFPAEICGGKIIVHSRVGDNLDFRSTRFEHRFNNYIVLSYAWTGCPHFELEHLTQMEPDLWSDEHDSFAPFKDPHPQGYQGVYEHFYFYSSGS